MLDFTKETLYQMPFLVYVFVILSLLFAVFLRWYHSPAIISSQTVYKSIAVISLISYQSSILQVLSQALRLSYIIPLSGSQDKLEWITKGVYKSMNLTCKTTFTTP